MTSLREVVRRLLGGGDRAASTRTPRSPNKASSFHLFWVMPEGSGPFVEVSATLEVVEVPQVERLYFWALQASFADAGRRFGAAHLGLQHHPAHPSHRAANWGGYRPEGGELDGSVSPFPAVRDNPNTRQFAWERGRPYRLTIRRAADGEWAGLIDGEEFRRLLAGGRYLERPMVWSEVFADCDHPPAAVRWSALEAVTAAGERVAPARVRVNYQSAVTGGCVNTDTQPDATGFIQRTGVPRVTRQDTLLPTSPPPPA